MSSRSIDDPHDGKESERAQSNRGRLLQIVDANGSHPFMGCVFVELVPKDPPAPPEWNLVNAQGKWSLQIAVYGDDPRSQTRPALVDPVSAKCGANGIKNAYFYHGATASSICIGTWPDSAVKQDQARPEDPNQPVLVTNQPVAGGDIYLRTTGQKLQQVTPKVQILDPGLQQTADAVPLRSHQRRGWKPATPVPNVVKGATPSYLLEIPHEQPSDASYNRYTEQTQLPPAFVPPPPPPTDSTTGRSAFDRFIIFAIDNIAALPL